MFKIIFYLTFILFQETNVFVVVIYLFIFTLNYVWTLKLQSLELMWLIFRPDVSYYHQMLNNNKQTLFCESIKWLEYQYSQRYIRVEGSILSVHSQLYYIFYKSLANEKAFRLISMHECFLWTFLWTILLSNLSFCVWVSVCSNERMCEIHHINMLFNSSWSHTTSVTTTNIFFKNAFHINGLLSCCQALIYFHVLPIIVWLITAQTCFHFWFVGQIAGWCDPRKRTSWHDYSFCNAEVQSASVSNNWLKMMLKRQLFPESDHLQLQCN